MIRFDFEVYYKIYSLCFFLNSSFRTWCNRYFPLFVQNTQLFNGYSFFVSAYLILSIFGVDSDRNGSYHFIWVCVCVFWSDMNGETQRKPRLFLTISHSKSRKKNKSNSIFFVLSIGHSILYVFSFFSLNQVFFLLALYSRTIKRILSFSNNKGGL